MQPQGTGQDFSKSPLKYRCLILIKIKQSMNFIQSSLKYSKKWTNYKDIAPPNLVNYNTASWSLFQLFSHLYNVKVF